MEAERWHQVETIFQLVLDCAPENRRELLETACGGDASLRDEVESLLASYEDSESVEAGAFHDGVRVLEQHADRMALGRRVGAYRIVREVGRGGMGTVYLGARADEAFQKFVAIKVLSYGFNAQDFIDRFRTERQILATLDHPNIARLLDGGATADGLPYFVMEYIDGEPIDRYCDSRKLNVTDRLRLFQGVCAAVRYAHEHLVVHRDIKPGNVLVTKEGIPRLVDFGIAKMSPEPGRSPETAVTVLRPFTPEFASPEQIDGRSVTTASDVYSLGALLYVLLTGRRCYRTPASGAADLDAAILREEPERPSASVTRRETPAGSPEVTPESVSAVRDGTPDKLRRRLHGDVDAIVLMAMRKEPERRYASVEQLSADISRHLARLPVVARLDTRFYRATRFVQRHKAGVAATAAVFLILIVGILVSVGQARIAQEERDRARVEQARAERVNAFLQEVVGYSAASPASVNRPKGHDATVIDMLTDAAQRVETELADEPAAKADLLSTIGMAYTVNAKYELAGRYLHEAYDLDLKVGAEGSTQMAEVMHQLANLAYVTGNYADADSWFGKAVAVYRKHANDPGFRIALLPAVLSDAAFGKRAVGRLDEAEALWWEALSYAPRLPAKNRAEGIAPKTYLAQLYVDRGDVARADTMASEAVRQLRAAQYLFQLPQALIDLGNVRRLQNRYAEAEAAIQEGTDLYARAQGGDNPNVAFGLAGLAMAHYDERRYDLAEQDARKGLKIVENLPKTSHYYAAAITPLGLILSKTGRTNEGEVLLREALAIRAAKAPRHSNVVAIALGNLGECLTCEKRYAEAEPLLTESYETLKSVHVPQSPVLRKAAERLTALYSEWGKASQAAHYHLMASASGLR